MGVHVKFIFSVILLSSFLPQTFADTLNPLSKDFKVSAQTSFATGAKNFFGFGPKPSQWSDVKSWKSVGDRFAAAYNANGKLIAVYDLSYPTLISPIVLGKISKTASDSTTFINTFNSALSEIDSTNLSTDIKKQIAALGNNPNLVAHAGFLSATWWTKLPWTAHPSSEPASFRLTDFDATQLKLPASVVSGLRNLLQKVLDDDGSLSNVSDQDILNSFQFVRASDGGFEFQWNDPRSSAITFASHPRKLLDFVNTHEGLYDQIAEEAIVEGLVEAVSSVPIPVVEALVATAISRLGRYYNMTEIAHLEMLHEVAIETSEGSIEDAVLQALAPNDQTSFINSFEWTRVTLMDAWKWIFTSPAAAWTADENAAVKCAEINSGWLTADGQIVSQLNTRFAFGTASDSSKSLYLQSDTCAKGSKGPTVSIDYQNPGAIAEARLKKEWVGIGLEFGSHFVPYAGFLVNTAYGYLVQNTVDTAEYWEARLTQHLERRNEDWTNELTILQGQRINPLEIDRQAMEQLVKDRKQQLGL
jgi:hypothetical protein